MTRQAVTRLLDEFPILAGAPISSHQNWREIKIEMLVVGTEAVTGVPASTSIGRERIRFVPLAEAKDDLAMDVGKRENQDTIDVRPKPELAERLLEALKDAGAIDIAFAPELCLPSGCEDAVSNGILDLADDSPRLVLAGSALTEEVDEEGRSWNEARVYARGGAVLWAQRKFWPYAMKRGTAVGYGLPDPGENRTLMEDTAAGDHLQIADLDGFGRCLLLICQDIQGGAVVDEVAKAYQPDWILTPILDPGVKISGWAHQRALTLSMTAQARLLIGSSLSLSHYLTVPLAEEPGVGLALGPYEPVEIGGKAEPRRALSLIKAAVGQSPRFGEVVWDYGKASWTRSTIGQEDAGQ